MTKEKFQTLYNQTSETIESLKNRSNLLSIIRFCLCILFLFCLLAGYFYHLNILYIFSLIIILLFMIFVRIHQKIKEHLCFVEAQNHIYNQHLKRINGEWECFYNGSEFTNNQDHLSEDLDIFGNHSLYQLINASFTLLGKERLSRLLKLDSTDLKEIQSRQESVVELSQNEDFVLLLQTYGELMNNNKIDNNMISSLCFSRRMTSQLIFILPLITLTGMILSLLHLFKPYSFLICEIGVVLQLALSFLMLHRSNEMFEPITHLHSVLNEYFNIFQLIENHHFSSMYLKNLQNQLLNPLASTKGIKDLYKIAQKVSYRKNIFAFILLNGFLSFDVLLQYQYQNWLQMYGDYIQKWFDALADLEACMSLSILKIDEFNVSIPCVRRNTDFSFKNLRHPLISQDHVIGNDFVLKKNINVITGSNMSGKTTFMRTIALNLVLAYAGGYVFAQEMNCSLMKIYTSMRVKDDVEGGISTFYGELLRIKEMIDESQKGENMICFIDEIFKGTNSLDRIAGAKATIEQLSLSHCITFITTHDFELCQFNDLSIQNYHFDEHYKNNKIYFDYLIKEGQSKSTNGQFLLKQLGIIKE